MHVSHEPPSFRRSAVSSVRAAEVLIVRKTAFDCCLAFPFACLCMCFTCVPMVLKCTLDNIGTVPYQAAAHVQLLHAAGHAGAAAAILRDHHEVRHQRAALRGAGARLCCNTGGIRAHPSVKGTPSWTGICMRAGLLAMQACSRVHKAARSLHRCLWPVQCRTVLSWCPKVAVDGQPSRQPVRQSSPLAAAVLRPPFQIPWLPCRAGGRSDEGRPGGSHQDPGA